MNTCSAILYITEENGKELDTVVKNQQKYAELFNGDVRVEFYGRL